MGAVSPRTLQGSAAGTITPTIPIQESFTTLPGSRTPLVSLDMSLTPQKSSIPVHKVVCGRRKLCISPLSVDRDCVSLIYASVLFNLSGMISRVNSTIGKAGLNFGNILARLLLPFEQLWWWSSVGWDPRGTDHLYGPMLSAATAGTSGDAITQILIT